MTRQPIRKTLLVVIVFGMFWPFHSDSSTDYKLPDPIAAALKRHNMPAWSLSLYVHEIGQVKPLLAFQGERPRNPASTIKLLTTLVALEELGPAWRWKTEAYASAPIREGHLTGDLYIKGYGDPYLVIEHFWRFLRALRAQGLETIDGDLIVDRHHFKLGHNEKGEFDDQPLRAYNVLPSALLVNFHAVNFRFIPQPAENRVHIVADPLPDNVIIVNQVNLTRGPCNGWARHLGLKVRKSKDLTRVVFSGGYEAACGDNDLFRVVSGPLPYILGTFRSLWSELGGRFTGGIRDGEVPEETDLLFTAYSPPLADIIRSINKYSNNVMARHVLLTLGAEQGGEPGTTDKGVEAVRSWIKRHGLNFPELVLENGAGLSRDEAISARHLGEVLLEGWRSPYMPEFVSSLPISAMDGTMRNRFNDDSMEGRMHLKTGSLDDVRTVAGYVLDRNGRRMVVVCLHNHPRADSGAGKAVQDAVLEWVYQRP